MTEKSEYELMSQVATLGVPMCKPLEFGTSDEGVYSIQTWIDGVDVEENVHNLTCEEQYSYGFEAGRILKEIHKIPAPKGIEDWEIYFNRKADRKIKMYEECPIKYENGQAFIDYINAHRYLLSGRPRTYRHGDALSAPTASSDPSRGRHHALQDERQSNRPVRKHPPDA